MSSPVSNSKKLRGSAAHGVDRLSSLPDPLLHLVMSFLPMPEVVRTCLLSPRWRDLWASVPFIHLDYNDFVDGEDDQEKRVMDQNRLHKFGDQLLFLRDGTLPFDEARILFRDGDFETKCDTWIRHAIRHKARLLHLYGSSDIRIIFDNRSMFSSQHLRRIKLQEVSLDDSFFKLLNFDFHVLEHLELEHCNVLDPQQMSSRLLKTTYPAVISTKHAFERGLQTCPVFGNLTSLVLHEWCMASDFTPLLLILRHSPKLKDLTFKLKMQQCGTCKDVYRHLSARKESSPENYPSIERTVIYCGKDDPRVSALVQVLLPIVIPCGEISIKGH
ncbi:hypothetical protein VPH35_048318 [Triticum aestivum]